MYVVRKPACSAALGWHMNTTAANIKSSCSRLLTATPKSRVFLGKYATWNLWLIRASAVAATSWSGVQRHLLPQLHVHLVGSQDITSISALERRGT